MGEMISLAAGDGHEFSAYRAEPHGAAVGGIVILQEIFGLTNDIRGVVDQYADLGFVALAPALFDRLQPDTVLDYDDVDRGRALMTSLDHDLAIADIRAAVACARDAGRVAVIGYCWGGAMADLAACRIDIDAAVSYYGRATVDWLDEQPGCPVLYHYGADDPLIPPDIVARISAARSAHESFVYDGAGHGFNCEDRPDFQPNAAELALSRTLAFLQRNLQQTPE